jgi:SAM-dependent methyltransferase
MSENALTAGHAAGAPPSDWVVRWASLIPPGGRVLDLACGSGRHLRWLTRQGRRVTGVDRDAQAVSPLGQEAEIIVADLENGPWPLAGRRFDGIVVTNYLWRPTLPLVLQALAPGGVLIYETFGTAHAAIGRPSRPEFLLRPGELLQWAEGLRIVAYEDGLLASPQRAVQRICAIAPPAAGSPDDVAAPPSLNPASPR